GSGYPDGLRGEEIPLSARIIAVADSYDAMTMERPYRTAKSPVQTMNEIEALQSIKYDPCVVKAFRRCFDRQL
ncbi:MAG: HD-GYP domain-containing protein, partial [bacterium]